MSKKIFLCSLFLLLFSFAAHAEGEENKNYHINLDKSTIAKGYTVSAFDDALKLSLVPGILNESTGVEVVELNEKLDMPWQLGKLSKVYQFEFKNKAAYDDHKPFYIQFSYATSSDYYKQVFYFDKNFNSWRPLPTTDFPKEKFVRSLIHLPFARIAVFENSNSLAIGKASWYKYKPGNFAASPDFPKGSRVRVYNVDNGKFVDVVINDYGPDRRLHPDRVIDLEKNAFISIASLGAGIINVRVEPLFVIADNGKTLGVPSSGVGSSPNFSGKAAVVMNEDTGEILYDKNPTVQLPLASLTKLIAIKVFLDTQPTLSKIVSYSLQDEEYNYEYVDNKWESARVKLKDGDTLSVEDLIYSALVGSANNAVESLVRVSGLARDEFIRQMNDSAMGWGATSTKFIEPTGLSPQNVSSAFDYAIMTKEVFKNPIIQKASTMVSYAFTTRNTKEPHKFRNTNSLIENFTFKITGSKTGYLNEAGYCLMMRAKNKNDQDIIVVTMGEDTKVKSAADMKELLDYGFKKSTE